MLRTAILLIISIFIVSFHPLYGACEDSIYVAPLRVEYNTLLYKMKINFGKHFFSGLMVVNKSVGEGENYNDPDYNIVFMSEIGLNIMEYKYSNGKMKLVKHTALFDKRIVYNMMMKYCILLIQDVNRNKLEEKIKNHGYLVKTKLSKTCGVRGKSYYLYDGIHDDSLVSVNEARKIYTRGLFPMNYTLEYNEDHIPDYIMFSQNFWKLNIEVRLLKQY